MKIKVEYIFLYLVGIFLFVFGNRQFLEKIKVKKDEKIQQQKMAEQAVSEFNKSFEVQDLTYDSLSKVLKNKNFNFQTVIVQADFNTKNSTYKVNTIETNDDENASDSL